MLLFRSLALGLLGACFFLLATRPQGTVVVAHPSQVVVAQPSQIVLSREEPPARDDVTVVDIARGLPGTAIASVIVLAANEHIAAIDDIPVYDAAAAFSAIELDGRSYLDVLVVNDAGTPRRVLVLAR